MIYFLMSNTYRIECHIGKLQIYSSNCIQNDLYRI